MRPTQTIAKLKIEEEYEGRRRKRVIIFKFLGLTMPEGAINPLTSQVYEPMGFSFGLG